MFSKDKIDGWITLAETGINKNKSDDYSTGKLKAKFIEAKCRNDRWGNVTTDYVVHSSQKENVRVALGNDLRLPNEPVIENDSSLGNLLNKLKSLLTPIVPEIPQEECDLLWGAKIHYSNNIQPDLGLALVLENDQLYDPPDGWDDGEEASCADRCVAVFPV
jgi:hypothetical protein